MTEKKKNYGSAFPNYTHIIHGTDYNPDQWLSKPEIIKEDIRLMKLAGINSVSLSIFAWYLLEPKEGEYQFEWLDSIMDCMAEHEIKVILATPSGARPVWMDKKYPEVMRVSQNRVRSLHGGRHNHCYTIPYYREKVASINRMLANRYKEHRALAMWHVSNEYGGECYCELCQQAFREWLRKKYNNDIKQLNEQWWTYFWSHAYSDFEEIEAPSEIGEYLTHGMNLDWKRFVGDQTKAFYENEIAPLKEITPQIPVTTNLQGIYKGFDPWRMALDMDVVSWDNYPRWSQAGVPIWKTASDVSFIHDMNRSLKQGRPFFMMESTPSLVNWHEVNKLKKPNLHELSSIQAIAHGSDSVQYFQWRKGRGGSEKFHGAVIDHYGKEDTRVFREVRQLGEHLKQLDEIVGTSVQPEVAVLFDWENMWAIEDLQGLNNYREYEETCKEHYESFWKQGVSVDIINMEQDFSQYKLIVAPMLYLLKMNTGMRLKQFVKNGGQLVLTYLTGYVNENDLCFLGGTPGDGLMEVAGLRAEEIDALYREEQNTIRICHSAFTKNEYKSISLCEIIYPKETCEVLATYGEDFYEAMPAVTKHKYGEGICYYIATRPEQLFLDEFYSAIRKEHNINCCIESAKLQQGVTIQKRCDETGLFYFIMNFTEEEKEIELGIQEDYCDIVTKEKIGKTLKLSKLDYKIIKKVK